MLHFRSARMVDLPGVAAVLVEAFSDKLRTVFGSQPERIQRLLEAVYSGPVRRGYDGVIVAESDGRIVGTLVIEPVLRTVSENRAFESLALYELGMPRLLWASFALWLLSHTPEDGDAHIGDVGVAADWQGQGIGQQLMLHAALWARDHDRRRLTLWVAAPNTRAIHVYEKTGFTITETYASWLARAVYGIRHWHFMTQTLDDTAADRALTLPLHDA
jgi:ribosomal protein S18 acetylase RimI-like enzyme